MYRVSPFRTDRHNTRKKSCSRKVRSMTRISVCKAHLSLSASLSCSATSAAFYETKSRNDQLTCRCHPPWTPHSLFSPPSSNQSRGCDESKVGRGGWGTGTGTKTDSWSQKMLKQHEWDVLFPQITSGGCSQSILSLNRWSAMETNFNVTTGIFVSGLLLFCFLQVKLTRLLIRSRQQNLIMWSKDTKWLVWPRKMEF